MNKRLNSTAQGGFTLIELIVVIVILGILAATALPKFSSLSGDARIAALNAARGSLNSVAAMAHGHALVAPSDTSVAFENVTVNLVNGYPKAEATLADAAGLKSEDYVTIGPGASATANSPATSGTEVAFIPASISGTTSGLNCYLKYSQAADKNTPPAVTVTGNASACQ